MAAENNSRRELNLLLNSNACCPYLLLHSLFAPCPSSINAIATHQDLKCELLVWILSFLTEHLIPSSQPSLLSFVWQEIAFSPVLIALTKKWWECSQSYEMEGELEGLLVIEGGDLEIKGGKY